MESNKSLGKILDTYVVGKIGDDYNGDAMVLVLPGKKLEEYGYRSIGNVMQAIRNYLDHPLGDENVIKVKRSESNINLYDIFNESNKKKITLEIGFVDNNGCLKRGNLLMRDDLLSLYNRKEQTEKTSKLDEIISEGKAYVLIRTGKSVYDTGMVTKKDDKYRIIVDGLGELELEVREMLPYVSNKPLVGLAFYKHAYKVF